MLSDLRHARFLLSCAELGGFPADRGAEVAFAGRSNAGKSSALNALTGSKGLARASKTPGRTQLINLFAVDVEGDARLADLPGYGYAAVPGAVRRDWQALVEAYLGARQCLKGLVLVMDIRHPLKESDRLLVEWAMRAGVPLHALLTKADKLSKAQAERTAAEARAALGPGVGVTVFSATKGTGRDHARRAVLEWLNP